MCIFRYTQRLLYTPETLYLCLFCPTAERREGAAGLSTVAVPSLQTVVLNRLLCMTFESDNDLRKSRTNANYRVKE